MAQRADVCARPPQGFPLRCIRRTRALPVPVILCCNMPWCSATCDDELEHAMACSNTARVATAILGGRYVATIPRRISPCLAGASCILHGACGNKHAACHTRAYQATRVRGEGAKRDAAPRSARSAVCSERLDERRHDGPHLLRPARPIQGYTGGRPSEPCCLPGRWKPLAFGDDRMRHR